MKRTICLGVILLLFICAFLLVSCDEEAPAQPPHVCEFEEQILAQADCTQDGKKIRTCCSCWKQEEEIIPKLGHRYSADHFCEVCYAMEEGTYTQGLEYSDGWLNTCVVKGAGSAKNATEIVIPAYHNGNKVIKISDAAFLGCKNLKSIDIPRTVETIGKNAFSGCSSLESMRMPAIGASDIHTGYRDDYLNGMVIYYFGDSPYPNTIEITQEWETPYAGDYLRGTFVGYVPASLKTVILTGCAGDASIGGTSRFGGIFSRFPIETLIIEDTVTSISRGFENCKKLKEVIFKGNSSLKSLGCFAGCTALESIALPNSVTTLKDDCFKDCTNLKSITLSNTLTTIGADCFNGCTALQAIVLPESLKKIENTIYTQQSFGYEYHSNAFRNCIALTEITLPSSLVEIGASSFYGCVNLKTVYNNSGLYIQKGSETHGGVAYYADTVISK